LQKRALKNFIETKARTILYPYFLWACLQITLQIFFSKYTNGHSTPQNYLYLLYLPREVDQFWYLYALFNVAVLYVLVKSKLKITPLQNVLIGTITFYLSALAHQTNINLGFVSDIFHYYIFFAIGDMISNYMSDRNNFKYFESWKTFVLLLLPFIAAQIYFLKENIDHANVQKYEFVEYYQPAIYIVIALTGCAFIMNLTFVLQKLKLKALSWLPELGRHSLYIYVAHVIVFASVRVLLRKVFGINDVPILMITCIVTGLIVPVILYKLAVKLNMRWLFTLEKENTTSVKATGYTKPLSIKTLEN
jgi:fucose 4-O-acetylase-like acetyltransferase